MISIRKLSVSALSMTTALAALSATHAANKVGWVLADQPNATAPYTPNAVYSYNSSGRPIKVVPQGAGAYEVDFNGLYTGSPDNVEVSAVNTSGYCMSDGWTNVRAQIQADVKCYDAGGNLANAAFTMMYQSRSAPLGTAKKGLAFLWANQPTSASYTPALAHQYNSTGGTNTIVRNGAGDYTVTIPGLTRKGGDVQVTAYSGFDAMRCKVGPAGWSTSATGTNINVQCFGPAGALHDEYFTLAYAVNIPFGLVTVAHSLAAYAWADQPANTSVYTPTLAYQYSGFVTGALSAQKTGTGQYTVSVPGTLNYLASDAFVTSYGAGNGYCNLLSWVGGSINVACYSQGGAPADAQFGTTLQTAE